MTAPVAYALLTSVSVALAGLLFAVFGFHSYHPSDQGFVLGYAWRIFGGQVPYRDFIHLRPPASIYLHSAWLWLPETWSFPMSRLGFYLQMTLSGLLPALWAVRAGLVPSPAKLALLLVVFTGIAIHNFPVMPWYTVDGVFFGSLGLSALLLSLTTDRVWRALLARALASASLAWAGLSKQPFALLPALLALFAAAEAVSRLARNRPAFATLLASSLPGAAVVAVFFAALGGEGALAPMVDQLTRKVAASQLGYTGFVIYLQSPAAWAMLPGLALAWLQRPGCRSRIGESASTAATWAICAALACALLVRDQLGHALFFVLLGACLGRSAIFLRNLRRGGSSPQEALRLGLQVDVLLIAWCASISWGLQTPILGLAPLAAVADEYMPLPRRRWQGFVPIAALTALTLFAVWTWNAESPYRDAPRARQTAAVHEVFPRFGRLYTNRSLAARMADLESAVRRHALATGRPFTVLPQYPLIHFLVDRQSPTLLDWYTSSEAQGFEPELLADFERFDGVLFLQREYFTPAPGVAFDRIRDCEPREYAQWKLLPEVFELGRVVEETTFFCVLDLGGGRAP